MTPPQTNRPRKTSAQNTRCALYASTCLMAAPRRENRQKFSSRRGACSARSILPARFCDRAKSKTIIYIIYIYCGRCSGHAAAAFPPLIKDKSDGSAKNYHYIFVGRTQTNIIFRAVCNKHSSPRSVTILLAVAQKSSLYYISTYFDRHRRTTCRESPLRATKNAVFTRTQRAADTRRRRRRDMRHMTDRKTISKSPQNTPHSCPQTTPQGIPHVLHRREIANRLHFSCKTPSFCP